MLMALVHETSLEPLTAEVALIAGCGEVSLVVKINKFLNGVDVFVVGRVIVLEKIAKIILEAVGRANVFNDCIDCVTNGGSV